MRKKIVGLAFVLTILVMIPAAEIAFAEKSEPGKYLDRRVVIWNLFFRLMTVAFTIGAIVTGTIAWLCFRFRESNPKAKPTEYEKLGEW